MDLVHDYIHPTPHRGRCRIRLYLPEDEGDAPVIICTELNANTGMSVTNAAEQIAGEVYAGHGLERAVWIEHYEDGARETDEDPQTFSLVTFASSEVREILRGGEWSLRVGAPSWSALDRATVETLVGQGVR